MEPEMSDTECGTALSDSREEWHFRRIKCGGLALAADIAGGTGHDRGQSPHLSPLLFSINYVSREPLIGLVRIYDKVTGKSSYEKTRLNELETSDLRVSRHKLI
ncbi:hypothetical protein BaRGS_00021175, partial [Batillaria attramentaria]